MQRNLTNYIAMKERQQKNKLTDKEEEMMLLFWQHGPLFVREVMEMLPEPRPHVNTVSTFVRALESKGYLSHEAVSGSLFRSKTD